MSRFRAWLTTVMSLTSLALAGLTAVAPDWIEAVFHLSPDAGSGSVEVGSALAFLVAAVVSGLAAVFCWRQALRAGAG
jgi:hypothetical protein